MSLAYHTLEFTRLNRETKLYQPMSLRANSVDYDEPAIMVMLDFKHVTPFSIEPTASLAQANEKMKSCGVRLLFVTQADATVLGLISADDILGDKPLRYIKEHGGNREDVHVMDIMTPRASMDVVTLDEISEVSVSDIIETMRESAKHHIVVTDTIYGAKVIRGIFSKTQISRQIGEEIELSPRAKNFMELEMALSPI